MALVLVVGSMLILAMFAMTALAYTLQSQRFARYSQDFSGAMAAAQSGIEDYVGHLNRDDVYGATPDCTNVALQGPIHNEQHLHSRMEWRHTSGLAPGAGRRDRPEGGVVPLLGRCLGHEQPRFDHRQVDRTRQR